jgi:1,4-alpha-glucan branching enzyme
MTIPVQFIFSIGLPDSPFSSGQLAGSWDADGMPSANWSMVPMTQVTGEDGCLSFTATVQIDGSQVGQTFSWGVLANGPSGAAQFIMPYEVNDPAQTDRHRSFELAAGPSPQIVQAWFCWGRRLGAQKVILPGGQTGARFSVYAPYAQQAAVVFQAPNAAYIDDQGGGIDPDMPVLALSQLSGGPSGVWDSDPAATDYSAIAGKPYLFRITNAQNQVCYRTDLYSRQQQGIGTFDPGGAPFTGAIGQVDGSVSCGIVVDPDSVIELAVGPVPSAQFWANEFSAAAPMPTRLQDLIIYEFHIGSLHVGWLTPGTLDDAIVFLDYLARLGVNAVELLPLAQCDGAFNWGYGDTHHFATQSAAGGRDDYKRFVRECHRRGIAVIQDVVYNHWDANAARAEWQYDSTAPDQNTYYWYQGAPSSYADPTTGGYVNNGSSGWTPRFWDENVRALFVSSALTLVSEFHIDGFRVDLTDAIHQDNSLNSNGQSVPNANAFGTKLLREWSRALRLVKPNVFLVAEDYTGWAGMTQPPDAGGVGFDAIWYADFIHHLVGDGNYGSNYARLIHNAGFGDMSPLSMDFFAGALLGSQSQKIVYNENHDEAGNESNTRRTILEAVNGNLNDSSRPWAEARCRWAFGALLGSAGTPMFFMGEEVGTPNPFPLDSGGLLASRINFNDASLGIGAHIFAFYRDMIAFRVAHEALRDGSLSVLYVHNANRVIAWVRKSANEQLLLIASLNNVAFSAGYTLSGSAAVLPDCGWQEVLNSDASAYGGWGVGNEGATLNSTAGVFTAVLPAMGLLVFAKTS